MSGNTGHARAWYSDPRVIIVAGCLIALIAFGVRATMGLFTAFRSRTATGWGREVFGFAMADQNVHLGRGAALCRHGLPTGMALHAGDHRRCA